MTQVQKVENGLLVLLNDYGYKVEGALLISKGIRGFCSDRIVRRNVQSVFDAAESLLSAHASDDTFYARFKKITAPA